MPEHENIDWGKLEQERKKQEEQVWSILTKAADNFNQTDFLVVLRRCLADYPDFRYDILKAISKGRVYKKTYPREYLKVSRQSFDKSFIKRPYKLGKCFICEFPPLGSVLIRHHIIALSNWGTNRRLNIVTLCSRCHCYFHPWLWDEWHETHKKAKEYGVLHGTKPRVIAPKASAYHS